MTESEPEGSAVPLWEQVLSVAVVTADLAERTLDATELARPRGAQAHRLAGERIAKVAAEMDRLDLVGRANLLVADAAFRRGDPAEGIAVAQRVLADASEMGEAYVAARAHFVLTAIHYTIGDSATARIHGAQSLDLLPDDAPTAIRVDHLIGLAIAHGKDNTSTPIYNQALELYYQGGLPEQGLRIYNNLAYDAWQCGDGQAAAHYRELTVDFARRHGMPLPAAILDTIARVHMLNHEYQQAIDVMTGAVSEIRSALQRGDDAVYDEPTSLWESLLTLAEAHRAAGDLDAAQADLDEARQIASWQDVASVSAEIHREQAYLDAAKGDFKSAYQHLLTYLSASESLRSQEAQARAHLVETSFDMARQRRDTERFRELAMRDALTGLPNRRFLDEQLDRLTDRARETRTPLSAAIIDADFFKRINDQLSHQVGDEVLRKLADTLASRIVEPHIIGRLGGEEFALLLPDTDAVAALAVAEELRLAVAEYPWETITGDIPVTVSIGVTTAPSGFTSPAALLADADRNLYAAKRSGRNRVMPDPV